MPLLQQQALLNLYYYLKLFSKCHKWGTNFATCHWQQPIILAFHLPTVMTERNRALLVRPFAEFTLTFLAHRLPAVALHPRHRARAPLAPVCEIVNHLMVAWHTVCLCTRALLDPARWRSDRAPDRSMSAPPNDRWRHTRRTYATAAQQWRIDHDRYRRSAWTTTRHCIDAKTKMTPRLTTRLPARTLGEPC